MGSNPTRSASFFQGTAIHSINPTPDELAHRGEVLERILSSIRTNTTIRIPDAPAPVSTSDFYGTVAGYAYLYEGEDDLLHISISRLDEARLTVEEAQTVVQFLHPELAPGIIWLKPGVHSHHFYFGHDELLPIPLT